MMMKRATTVLVLSLVCCSGLAPPIRLKRTITPTQGWTASKNWKSGGKGPCVCVWEKSILVS